MNAAFHDLPADKFPIKIEYMRSDTREVLHTQTMDGPGVLRVPGLGTDVAYDVAVRLTFGDGTVEEAAP